MNRIIELEKRTEELEKNFWQEIEEIFLKLRSLDQRLCKTEEGFVMAIKFLEIQDKLKEEVKKSEVIDRENLLGL